MEGEEEEEEEEGVKHDKWCQKVKLEQRITLNSLTHEKEGKEETASRRSSVHVSTATATKAMSFDQTSSLCQMLRFSFSLLYYY